MNLKVKKLVPEAVLPKQAKADDAGYDLVAISDGQWSEDRTYIEYDTGLAIEPPKGYHTEIFPRSSISKTDLVLANSLGLVDGKFRGSLRCRFKYIPRTYIHGQNPEPLLHKKGDKIAQLVIRKTEYLEVEEVSELSQTERAEGGFGSTGR